MSIDYTGCEPGITSGVSKGGNLDPEERTGHTNSYDFFCFGRNIFDALPVFLYYHKIEARALLIR